MCGKWRWEEGREDSEFIDVRVSVCYKDKTLHTENRHNYQHFINYVFLLGRLTSCVMFRPAGCAIVAPSSPATVAPSSLRCGAFFVDCILICGGLEFDGKLLVDCNSWRKRELTF